MDDQRCEGVGYEQMRVMQALRCGGPAIMREVGAILAITPRNMTAIVDSLQETGLVVRRPHPGDRRATLLELTPAGDKLAGAALAGQLARMGKIFDELPPGQQQEFYDALIRLTEAMRPAGGECC